MASASPSLHNDFAGLTPRISHADDVISGHASKSKDIIPESVDKAMDKANPPVANGAPGISIRNGPVDEMDVDEPSTNGHAGGKRKSRGSLKNNKTYKEESEDEEGEKPIVSEVGTSYENNVTDV